MFATYLKTFAKIFITPMDQWNTAVLDALLKEGNQLFSASADGDIEAEEANDIYSKQEAKVGRAFELDSYKFQVELEEKFRLQPVEKMGDAPTPELTITVLRPHLKAFFRKRRYGLIKATNWYILILRAVGAYFVFDFNGRNIKNFLQDRETGTPMLICLNTLDNVYHLIAHLSALQRTDPYSLRALKVVKLVEPDGKTASREYGRRDNEYEVISSNYAFLTSALHLTLNPADPLRNRSALPVGVAALLTAKIDHPATWNRRVLDKIICYGVNVCRYGWHKCLQGNNAPIELDEFPTQLQIGQFWANYSLGPAKYEGMWRCVPNWKLSELTLAIMKCFAAAENNLLVQVDHQMYAIWKKHDFIYLFDPYRHRIVGSHHEKSASLRMFRSIEVFFEVFTQLLLESNRTTKFYIHSLHINRIKLAEAMKTAAPPKEILAEEKDGEVISLNELICFEEDQTKCMEELGVESDWEEAVSDIVIVEEEPKEEPEIPAEEGLEEEEGGIDTLGEYESSSSGDGSKSRKKKKKLSKKDRDKKSKKGKKAKKGKSDEEKDKKKKKGKKKGKSDDDKKSKKKKKGKSDTDDSDSKKKKKDKKDKKKKSKSSESEDDDKDKKKKKKKSKSGSDEDEPDKKKRKSKEEARKSKEEKRKSEKEEKEEEEKRKSEEEKRKSDPKTPPEKRLPSEAEDEVSRKKPSVDWNKTAPSTKKEAPSSVGEDDSEKTQLAVNYHNYPGYSAVPHDMAVVGSECGSYESICKLLRAGFRCADRVLTMTPWANYVIFRGYQGYKNIYLLFDGCTCNVDRFRHLDLNCGTAGLLCFDKLHDAVSYIIDSRQMQTCLKRSRKNTVDEICRQYCG